MAAGLFTFATSEMLKIVDMRGVIYFLGFAQFYARIAKTFIYSKNIMKASMFEVSFKTIFSITCETFRFLA